MMLRTKTAAQLLLLGSSAGGPNFSLVGAVDTAKEQNRESMLNKQKEGCTPEAKNEAKTAPAAAAGPYADLTCEEYDKLPVLAKVSVQCDSGAAFYRDASKIAKPGRVEEVKKACCKIAEGPGGGASFLQLFEEKVPQPLRIR
ncbi:unnamed protein product [Amoebophrya sp. A120]|nr:unnamed protein product [Amoebophrya sp. A120]|eukprot:GSA120T00023644001.1